MSTHMWNCWLKVTRPKFRTKSWSSETSKGISRTQEVTLNKQLTRSNSLLSRLKRKCEFIQNKATCNTIYKLCINCVKFCTKIGNPWRKGNSPSRSVPSPPLSSLKVLIDICADMWFEIFLTYLHLEVKIIKNQHFQYLQTNWNENSIKER